MLPTLDPNGKLEDTSQSELELMLQAHHHRQIMIRERELNIYRSGSAPPTVEGSRNAVDSLFRNPGFGELNSIRHSNSGNNNRMLSEDELRSHPAYLSYYYMNDNINPRLPPPLLSKEDWRVAQRFQASGSSFGGTGDWMKKKAVGDGDNSSLFAMQLGLSAQNDLMELRNVSGRNQSSQASVEWLDRGTDGLNGFSSAGLGGRKKSFADILQEGLDRPASLSGHLSRPASRNAIGDFVDMTDISDPHPAGLCDGVESIESLYSGAAPLGLVGVQSQATASHAFSSAVVSSLSRSTTPELQKVVRFPGSGLPPVGSRAGPVEKRHAVGATVQNGHSSGMVEPAEMAATLAGLSLSKHRHADENSLVHSELQVNLEKQPDFPFNMSNGHSQRLQQRVIEKSGAENLPLYSNYADLARRNGILTNSNASRISCDEKINIPRRTSSSASLHSNYSSSGFGGLEGAKVNHQNTDVRSMDAYSVKQTPNLVAMNHLGAGSVLDGGNEGKRINRLGNQIGPDLSPFMDPDYVQNLQRTSDDQVHAAAGLIDHSQVRDFFGGSRGDLDGLQNVYLEMLLAQQKQQYELPLLGNYGDLSHGYYGNPSLYGIAYPGNPMANSLHPSVGLGSSQNDQLSRFTSPMRNPMRGSIGSWHSDIGSNMEGSFAPSLLEVFKNNKIKPIELSDIVGHVVDFSMDQYGSRFIQQKLETASVEYKSKIFPEIIPHARTLMTDVFGNYVIQKFFEHGTESQRKELASQLTGHVLPLSLQMYGCRVIQKALEVIGVDQQTGIVQELVGSIMKCVRDQNGNHVIQKCIECVPQDRIQFIISSFYGQVISLSTHPYGCRVIQRVLEHCDDLNTQQIIMDEIMQSVCTLAQDQYGNYVIQHVLEHGKPHERSAIITQLAGQIVKMSQQKFASNVVEKCLTFGGPEERQLLVKEMLGTTDENEPLQAMMKDPFGNYVVQKVLETCDDQSLQLILSRIKVHLNAVKRYTYGKHIVSRVEKLIMTGERRIGLSSSISS